MELFQILDDACGGLLPVIKFIRRGVLPVIQIGIPILLILMGSIDLGKAVLSSDDKEIKASTGKLIKRAIAAIAVFFVATLVTVIMGWLTKTDDDTVAAGDAGWKGCWSEAGK